MGLQKYRADTALTQPDGARVWRSKTMYCTSLAKVDNCRWESLEGAPRVTAYAQNEPDTWFSVPAKARYLGRTITGYLTIDDSLDRTHDGQIVFRHTYY